MEQTETLKVAEAAKLLRVNIDTVRRWLRVGTLHGSRPGGTRAGWRIPASEVERVLKGGSE